MGDAATIVTAGLAAALASAAFMIPARALLRGIGSLDVPNHRSSHVVSTLRGGGVALIPGVVVGAAIAAVMDGSPAWGVVIFGVLFGVLGFADDVSSLPAAPRLIFQVLLASALVMIVVSDPSEWTIAPAVLLVVGYVNAFNFMDGINGISGLHALVVGGAYLASGVLYGEQSLALVGTLTLGAGVGFLPWNMPRARVFLGDSGSYLVGSLIAGSAVLAVVDGLPTVVVIAPLWIYLVDTASVLAKRAIGGRPLLEAHREHVYQRMADHWGSHARTAVVVAAFSAVPPLLALMGASYVGMAVVFAVMAGTYLALPHLARTPVGTT